MSGRGAPGGVRRRQGVRRPVNIGRKWCFQGVRKASGRSFGPVRIKIMITMDDWDGKGYPLGGIYLLGC